MRRFLWPVLLIILAAAGILFWLFRPHAGADRSETIRAGTRIYFPQRGSDSGPPLPVRRRLPAARTTTAILDQSIRALLAGPTAAERKQGYFTSLPPGTKLLSVEAERPYAYLNFSRQLEQMAGIARIDSALAQLAYTAASIPGVKGLILQIEGETAGTRERPFTGEGALFRNLHPAVDSDWAGTLGPADALDLFIVAIPDRDEMWKIMGPNARRVFGAKDHLDTSAFAEGLGSWRRYRVTREEIADTIALVEIKGRQVLEGMVEPNASYLARMVQVNGQWKWELPSGKSSR